MYTVFLLVDYFSVFIMLACTVLVCTHKESKMQKLASLVCLTLLICCFGFLVKLEGTTAEVMIIGQKLVYATVTHSMFLMLLFILQYCRFTIPKVVEWVFHSINLLITAVVLTVDYHSLFYKSYWAVKDGEYYILEKEYGPFHTIAVALFVLYMAAAVITAVIFSVQNIRERSRYVWRLMVAISFPCAAYIIPKITGINNDLQPLAFAAFTVMVIIMVYKNNIYDVSNIAMQFIIKSMDDILIVFDNDCLYKGCNSRALDVFPVLNKTGLDSDIRKKSDMITDILNGKISEFVFDKKIYSASVKPIENGNRTIGKVIWMSDITLERNYTDLLENQKNTLQSEVESLSEISNTDELTGLENRRSYESMVSKLRNRNDVSECRIIVLDINGLKKVNDNYGHKAGDDIIVRASSVITSIFGQFGRTFRIGGDEFVVIIDGDLPLNVFDEFLKTINDNNKNEKIALSIAYGYADGEKYSDKSVDELIRTADKLMYDNKRESYL